MLIREILGRIRDMVMRRLRSVSRGVEFLASRWVVGGGENGTVVRIGGWW